MMRAQTRDQIATVLVELQMQTASNEQLVGVIDRAYSGAELTSAEQRQINYRFIALLRYWENVHYQYRQGLYDDFEFASQLEAIRHTFRNVRPLADFWCRARLEYSSEFAAEIDNLLDKKC
jgi:hypothetical protein